MPPKGNMAVTVIVAVSITEAVLLSKLVILFSTGDDCNSFRRVPTFTVAVTFFACCVNYIDVVAGSTVAAQVSYIYSFSIRFVTSS